MAVPPSNNDVKSMVAALFTMNASLDRARRERKGASTLSLLQVVGDHAGIRPSEIADLQQVHPSLVTRQVRELEESGFVTVAADPADGRSCLVTLSPAGSEELHHLVEFGLKRFAAPALGSSVGSPGRATRPEGVTGRPVIGWAAG
jgi:DNA-binding MarR family transcriptional regulator